MHFVSVHILKLMSSFGPSGNHIHGNMLHIPGHLMPKPALHWKNIDRGEGDPS